jgi:hypothetical protein
MHKWVQPMKLYIAGPISGKPIEERRKAFSDAADALRGAHYETMNPTEYPPICDATCEGLLERPEDEHARACILKWDIVLMLSYCQGVAVLRGWEHSKGATMEVDIARHCGLEIKAVREWLL